jgi:excisionase family DNA binding protein
MPRKKRVPPKRKSKPAKRKRAPVPKGLVTVAQAAELLKVQHPGVYAAIKRGEFRAVKRNPILLSRAEVMEGRRQRIEFYTKPKPDPLNLTDEEFLRRMWESDPD